MSQQNQPNHPGPQSQTSLQGQEGPASEMSQPGVIELSIRGMTCSHCERAVAGELERVPGVRAATADAVRGMARVEADRPLSRAALAAAVAEAGYELADD